MKDFFQSEEEQLSRVREMLASEEIPPTPSFVYSEYLEGIIDPVLFISGEDKALVQNVAHVAYERFSQRYLTLTNIALRELCNVTIPMDELLKSQDKRDHLKEQLQSEPFIAWLLDEAMPLLNRTRRRLKVKTVEELSALIRSLDYVSSLLTTDKEDNDVLFLISGLYRIPGLLRDRLSRNSLLEDEDTQLWGRFGEFVRSLSQSSSLTNKPVFE